MTALPNQHGGAVDPIGGEVGQGVIGLIEPVRRRRHPEAVRSRHGEELAGLGPGVGGDAADPEEVALVVQRRDVGEVNARDGRRSAPI